jgi:hypothetical protein
MRKYGIGGIPGLAICLTFAGFDWLIGLDYHWYSTMWGVYLLPVRRAVRCRYWY